MCWGAAGEWRAMRTDSSPSLTSSSAIPDCSSNSISVLILRRSMASSVSRGELGMRGLQRQAVALGPEADDHAPRDVGEIGVAAKGFAPVGVGQVDLDERDRDRE